MGSGVFVGAGTGVSVGFVVGVSVGCAVGVGTGVLVAVLVGTGVPVGVLVAVAVAGGRGVLVGVGVIPAMAWQPVMARARKAHQMILRLFRSKSFMCFFTIRCFDISVQPSAVSFRILLEERGTPPTLPAWRR